jgi:class 3 adenylate cyclase/predicted ATPase
MTEQDRLVQAIKAIEEQRGHLDDGTIDLIQNALREKIQGLNQQSSQTREPQQRKLVTVLFADASGFTALAETMDHEEVTSVINSLWSRVDKAILDHGGRIDKHIGDAVMALFGTPIAQEDDPERAIRAALQIQAEIQEWKQEFDESASDRESRAKNIQLRIGINTGPALLGTIGTTNEYTAIGDTVNLASRLEHAAPVGGILISHHTYRHVRGIFEVTALEPITVKGKNEPVQVYVVNRVKPRSFRVPTRGVEGIETRTIGREAELGRMKALYEATLSQRQIHLLTLVAEAGTGKSRLLYEFNNWLDLQPEPPLLLKGRSTQEMAKIPYGLLRDVFSFMFKIQDTDSAAVARDKLQRGMESFTEDDKTATLYTHFIGHLIGFDFSTSPHLQGILGDARQIRDLAFHYISQFFADATKDQAIVILLEDIHWADSDSLELFEHLMSTRPDLPLFMIGSGRSSLFERYPDWGGATSQSTRIDLKPLSDEDARKLVAEILQNVPKIPAELMDLIIDKAEGSPFYIEELIKVLIENGVIIRDEKNWKVDTSRLAQLAVPQTLTGVLQARLDSLPAAHRETLQQASVMGRVFWTDVVDQMHSPESQEATTKNTSIERLNTLRSKELIFQYQNSASTGMLEYIFKSAILHDVTYESVLLRLRRVYHRQVAEGLIWLSGERVNEYAGRIGEHYESAGEWLRAAEWYSRAGKQARDTYSTKFATEYYEKALGFLRKYGGDEHVPQQLEICLRLGEVLNWQALYLEAIENYQYMLSLAETCGDILAQSRAYHGSALSLTYLGEQRSALESARQAENLARAAKGELETAQALWVQGSAHFRLGETRTSLTLAEQALEITTRLQNRNEMARCLNLLGAVSFFLGQYAQAQNHWESALAIFQELGNRTSGMDILSNLGVLADAYGNYELAFQRYHEALEIALEVGSRDSEIVFLTNRGGEQVALERYGAAEADLRKAIGMAGITGSWCLPNTYSYHAEAMLGLERHEEAYYSARQSLALAEEHELPENIGIAWRTLGIIADRMGRSLRIPKRGNDYAPEYDSDTCFSKSEKILAEAGLDVDRARTLREWAKHKFRLNDRERGLELWKEAREIFTRLGAQLEVDRMVEEPS